MQRRRWGLGLGGSASPCGLRSGLLRRQKRARDEPWERLQLLRRAMQEVGAERWRLSTKTPARWVAEGCSPGMAPAVARRGGGGECVGRLQGRLTAEGLGPGEALQREGHTVSGWRRLLLQGCDQRGPRTGCHISQASASERREQQ